MATTRVETTLQAWHLRMTKSEDERPHDSCHVERFSDGHQNVGGDGFGDEPFGQQVRNDSGGCLALGVSDPSVDHIPDGAIK
jgi:hypothetical protein